MSFSCNVSLVQFVAFLPADIFAGPKNPSVKFTLRLPYCKSVRLTLKNTWLQTFRGFDWAIQCLVKTQINDYRLAEKNLGRVEISVSFRLKRNIPMCFKVWFSKINWIQSSHAHRRKNLNQWFVIWNLHVAPVVNLPNCLKRFAELSTRL